MSIIDSFSNSVPQTRPPFVNAAVDIAAIAAVSAPGTLLEKNPHKYVNQ